MSRERIDVHAHFIPEPYRAAMENAGQTQPDGIKAIPAWTEDAALASMADLGISKSYLSISSPGIYFGDQATTTGLARTVNEEAVGIRERNRGRFGFFASVPLPDADAAQTELVYALDHLGADGLVLMTNTDGIYLGDERIEPLYAELNRRRSVLFVHPTTPFDGAHLALGYPRPMLEFFFDTTRSITNLIIAGVTERYPDLRIIVPHAGAALPILANRIELLLPLLSSDPGASPPQVKDTLKRLHFDIAGAPVPELLAALLAVADPANLHYGSDFPFTPHAPAVRLASVLDASELVSELLAEAINVDNSRALFGAGTGSED
jgi:predicted TIM-barrel fold metal-dependent hydrolase